MFGSGKGKHQIGDDMPVMVVVASYRNDFESIITEMSLVVVLYEMVDGQ